MNELPNDARHFFQWFILSTLQACANDAEFLERKCEFYDFARRYPNHRAGYYITFLLEELRQDPQNGTLYFSDKVGCTAKPPQRKIPPVLRVIQNKKFRQQPHPLESFKI
ncbi:MAG: hypothetical protein ACRBCS_06620 [Cellvibrionaceae bacterium]